MLLVFAILPVVYATNDDGGGMLVMLGYYGGAPSGAVPYMGLTLPSVCAALYAVAPHIPWWTLMHLLVLSACMAYAGRTVLLLIGARMGRCPLRWGMPVVLALDFCLYAAFICRLQFTTTGTLAATTAILCSSCWKEDEEELSGGALSRIVLPALLIAASFGYRPLCAQLGILFWGLFMAARFLLASDGALRSRISRLRFCVVPFSVSVLVVVVCTAASTLFFQSPEWKADWDLAVAQGQYTDYPMSDYQENPDSYNAVGWDADLAYLSRHWFFMDSRQTLDAYEHVLDENNKALSNLVSDPVATIKGRLYSVQEQTPTSYICLTIGVSLLGCWAITRRRQRLGLYVLAGTLLASECYLVISGRVNDRAAYAALLPAAASITAYILTICASESSGGARACSWDRILFTALCIIFVVLWGRLVSGTFAQVLCVAVVVFALALMARRLVPGLKVVTCVFGMALVLAPGVACLRQYGFQSRDYQTYEARFQNTEAFFDLCERTPDLHYIADLDFQAYPQSIWSLRWPSNQTNWGGWKNVYKRFHADRASNGFDEEISPSEFLDPDVRFVSALRENDRVMLSYLRGLYGDDIQMIAEGSIGEDIIIYRFTRSEA